jgi:hypothetical protein
MKGKKENEKWGNKEKRQSCSISALFVKKKIKTPLNIDFFLMT